MIRFFSGKKKKKGLGLGFHVSQKWRWPPQKLARFFFPSWKWKWMFRNHFLIWDTFLSNGQQKKNGGCHQPSGPWRKVLLLVSPPSTREAHSLPWCPAPLVAERYPPQKLEDLQMDLPGKDLLGMICMFLLMGFLGAPPTGNNWLSCHKQRTSPLTCLFEMIQKATSPNKKEDVLICFCCIPKRTARRLTFEMLPSSVPLPPPPV